MLEEHLHIELIHWLFEYLIVGEIDQINLFQMSFQRISIDPKMFLEITEKDFFQ